MTEINETDVPPPDILDAVESMCRDVVNELAAILDELRQGKLGDIKALGVSVRDLRAAFALAVEERGRVEKLRKQEDGIANDYALDFDKARDEIARRLDRLGRARGD